MGAYLSRLRPSAAFVDDVRQALREKLFVGKEGVAPKIGEYNGRAALSSWLRVIAVRMAIDMRRASREGRDAGGEEADRAPPGAVEIDPEVRFIQQRYRGAFNDALRAAIDALEAHHREILRLHFVEGRTLDQLAASLGVHRATVARRIKAAREAVLDRGAPAARGAARRAPGGARQPRRRDDEPARPEPATAAGAARSS